MAKLNCHQNNFEREKILKMHIFSFIFGLRVLLGHVHVAVEIRAPSKTVSYSAGIFVF